MNFQQLEYVLAVHEHRHFARAAESCNITQATLSAMIKKLEMELNLVLFDRSRHPIKTTESGIEFVEIAGKILRERNKLYSITEHPPEQLSGKLKLGVIPTVANSLLPMILPMLLKENPELELSISEITTEEIRQKLLTDQIDLGLLATPLEDDLLEESILYYEPMMVYGVKGDKNYVTSKDIKNRKVWLLEEGHCFRRQSMVICSVQEKDLHNINLNFEGSSFNTLLNMTDQFGGITLIPELFYKEMSPSRRKKTKPFESPVPVREISLVSYGPHSMRKTVDFLSKRIQKLVCQKLTSYQMKNSELEIIGI